MRLGVDKDHAYAWSRTRKGGWRIAQSPILTTTITLLRLKKKGYRSMLEICMELNPSLCEPPYTRPAWPVLSEDDGNGGVRGALRQLLTEPSTHIFVININLRLFNIFVSN